MLNVPADPEGVTVAPAVTDTDPTLNVAALPVIKYLDSIVAFPMLNVAADPLGVILAVPVTVKDPAENVAVLPLGITYVSLLEPAKGIAAKAFSANEASVVAVPG